MPGGNKNIKPSDNPKPFQKGHKITEKWTEKIAIKLAEDLIAWQNEKDSDGNDKGNMFFEEFLVINRELHPDTISYLCGKFSTFSELIGRARKIQELKLVKYGVGDRLNAAMTKFTLINNHDWKDKKEIEQTGAPSFVMYDARKK